MGLHRQTDTAFNANLRTVTRFGLNIPEEIAAMKQRLDAFTATVFNRNNYDAVIDSIQTGTAIDTPNVWAAALAEAAIADAVKNEVAADIRARVNARAQELYAAVAIPNYEAMAQRFTQAAQGFTASAAIQPPDTPAEDVVLLGEKQRKAWSACETHAAEMERLIIGLKVTAEMAGLPTDPIRLCVDPNGVDARTIRDCWDVADIERAQRSQQAQGYTVTPGDTRLGRWTALWKAGAILRAAAVAELTAVPA